jgi:hypothetical protein
MRAVGALLNGEAASLQTCNDLCSESVQAWFILQLRE